MQTHQWDYTFLCKHYLISFILYNKIYLNQYSIDLYYILLVIHKHRYEHIKCK